MELTLVVLGLGAVGLAAVVVWLGVVRARLAQDLGAARAGLEAAERERAELKAEVEKQAEQIRSGAATIAELGVRMTELRERLAASERAHRDEAAAIEASGRAEVERVEQVARERMVAVERERDGIRASLAQVEQKFRDVFGALAGEALKQSTEQFLKVAEQKLDAKRSAVDDLVRPIAETLKKTDEKLAVIEAAGAELRSETGKLVRALREPHVRGRYGELQLRRVAELAGMSAYCDFAEQDQTRGPDGTPLRPDMVIRLPSSRTVVVDAKTNVQAYVDAAHAPTEAEQGAHLERFARHVSEQVTALARKKYWAQYDGSPEFVVMFIPGDHFLDAALRRNPELLERAAEQNVILASPGTLIGLLRAVAVGYREETLARAAEDLRTLGHELHARVATALEHFDALGRALGQAVEKYNDFVGSYERRLEPTLRRFEESGVKSGKDLPAIATINTRPKALRDAALLDGAAPALLSPAVAARPGAAS